MTTAMRTPSTPTPKSPTTTTNGFNSPSASFHAMSSSSYSYGRSNGAAPQRPSMGGRAVSRGSISGSAVIRRRSQGHQFGGASYKLSIVSETSSTLKRKSMAELGSAVSSGVCSTNFIQFIEWIRSERLATLPHKGSRWDKVLIRAQHFAEQLNGFDAAIRSFAIDSTTAAEMGYGHARLLLELGYENSEALDKVFAFFYKCSLTVSSLLARSELLSVTAETREQLCMMYSDLLTLVTDVAIRFYKTVHGMMSSSTSLDMFEVFGDTIDTFRSRRARIVEEIWMYQIENEGFDLEEAINVDVLSNWLSPQDHVLATLTRDHTTYTDHQAEFTCLWFQKPLSKFILGNEKILLVNGEAGSGKTVLSASIADRLQRPISRKTVTTLFCSISAAIPTQATSLHVVKSLLFQLLNLRVGNMAIYEVLTSAYEHARHCISVTSYEDHLWSALAEALKHTYENTPELVLIIDGLDELTGGAAAAQTLFEKLADVTTHGRNVKLISLSKALKMPAKVKGVQVQIKTTDIEDDIHAVTLRALRGCHSFHGQDGPEQESVLTRIMQASTGSFLRAILMSEVLKTEKTKETFMTTLATFEDPKTPQTVEILTDRLLKVLNPDENARMVLSWLQAAERPLTVAEIRTLFSIDVQRGIVSDKGIHISDTIKPLRPILSIHENIVRLRHQEVHNTVKTLVTRGTVKVPIKDGEVDMLLRSLLYAKYTLQEKYEPTFTGFDQGQVNRLFNHNVFLDYVVRYWAHHLQQSSLAPKQPNGEFNVTPELKKVFPTNVTLPLLEYFCWETEMPTQPALEQHLMVSRLRKQILTESSLAVLQTYITLAVYYNLLSNKTDTAKYYYLSNKISRTILSEFHDLTVECCTRFLHITETMTFTSRTDIVTYKEEVLQVLIKIYTKQYGATSEIVIQTKTTLAQLYTSIKEEQRATQIYIEIREATIEHYGRHSDEARGASEHLNIRLGKDKGDKVIETIGHLFIDSEDEEEAEVFSLDLIIVLLRRAEAYFKQQDFYNAELTYIELWQQVSSRCRTTRSIEWHEKNIEVALAYSQFLRTQKREIETTSVLTSVWQEYEHNELRFSQTIVEKFTQVAKVMKSMGHYASALSIFKYASHYYSSSKKEESSSFTEIEEEVASTSTEVVKQSLTQTTTTTTETVSSSTFQSVFQSMISNETKTIDKTTMVLAKKLTIQYMEEQKYSQAVTIIESTLRRTWSSFYSESVHSVHLTSSFLEESVELVEQLAKCYLNLRLLEKVENVYIRLFQALLISKKTTEPLFDKVKWLLINFYDKYGFPDKAIGVFQEILVVYRTTLGHNHKLTIETLYTLGSRCRTHARNHPYWIEYYQQILVVLNKDSDVCHHDAMEAIIIVGTYYWEDRRYAEAATIYAVLWNTFVLKTKEYKQFSETLFVKRTYERYFQCLEETRAELETLHKVTSQYRETCVKTFGSTAEISLEATVSLAQVSQRSEKYLSQAISLYEEVSKVTTTTTTTTTFNSTEVREKLMKLYKRQMTSSSSSSSTETVERAISIYAEQYEASRTKFGYSSITTLSHMRELVTLYSQQKKTEFIHKELTTAVTQIVTKETSSTKLLESATYIAETFQMCKMEESCRELIEELHIQIIAKHTRQSSKFSFNLTSCGQATLVFLAGLEFHMRTDFQLTFTEIMADLLLEAFQFDNFKRLLRANEALDKIIIAAAPLRAFLIRKKRRGMVTFLEGDIIDLFTKRDTAKLRLRSKNSPRYFIIAILEHLGQKKSTSFIRSVINASNDNVATLTRAKQFDDAYDVANCAFLFALHHKGYTGPRAISQGFKLALLLAGRDESEKCKDPELRKLMLQLSNKVIKSILEICKEKKVNFASLQLVELNQLASLLGEQEDYETLEWLLSTLWNTRDAQRSWHPQVLLNLGRRLICARYLAGRYVQAVRLCEDIAYNMRRVHGIRHPATLETFHLLAQLYTSVGNYYQKSAGAGDKSAATLAQQNYRKALMVHEDLLKNIVYEGTVDDDDDDELDSTAAILSRYGGSDYGSTAAGDNSSGGGMDQSTELAQASQLQDKGAFVKDHLRLLKFAYQRLGGWPKSYGEYEKLNADLFSRFGGELKGIEGVEKWNAKSYGAGKAESGEGVFEGCRTWQFAEVA